MAFDREGLDRVMRAFDEGDWDEIHLTADGIELHLSVFDDQAAGTRSPDTWAEDGAAHPAGRAPDPVGTPPAAAVVSQVTALDRASGAPVADAGAPVADAGAPVADSGAIAVVAQSPGIFWRSPQPGAPPYADVGDHVDAGATLCIVEVMKLMNHVTAQCAGTVAEVIARNGEQVERGQLLFRLVPDGPDAC
jgi:acetyl-CoA carboxylase biotin carboxyl carrier protein